MNKLFAHNIIFREHFFFLIGVCLCLYFSYHTVLGNRSIVRLYAVEKQIETLSLKSDEVSAEKDYFQKRVVMMRPGSVDKDLLEGRARSVLGYRRADEYVILSN